MDEQSLDRSLTARQLSVASRTRCANPPSSSTPDFDRDNGSNSVDSDDSTPPAICNFRRLDPTLQAEGYESQTKLGAGCTAIVQGKCLPKSSSGEKGRPKNHEPEDDTYLSGLQEVDVLLPNFETVLVLANMAQRKVVTFADHLTRIRTGRYSPACRLSAHTMRDGLQVTAPDIRQIELEQLYRRSCSQQESSEECLSLAELRRVVQEVLQVGDLNRGLDVLAVRQGTSQTDMHTVILTVLG